MRTLEELTPLATQIASNLELMKKFREVMGSGDEDRARVMVDEVRHFAQTLDPTVTYAEGARITLVLMTIIRDQSGD